MRAISIILAVILTGCAASLDRVKEMRDNAPDWYEGRKQELFGRAYPKIGDVPAEVDVRPQIRRLELSQEETLAALELFANDARSDGAIETPEEMAAWAADIRRAVEGRLPPPDFLTDDEVAALKAVFNRPRGRL